MAEFGEFFLTMVGISCVVLCVRVAWVLAEPVSMWLFNWVGYGELEWKRGSAKGRPDIRYIKDGWGRVIYCELDPDAVSKAEQE